MTYLGRAWQSFRWGFSYWRFRDQHSLYPQFYRENFSDAWMYLKMAITGRRPK